jgi:hypothetical protein
MSTDQDRYFDNIRRNRQEKKRKLRDRKRKRRAQERLAQRERNELRD